jgi:prepilin-type N-terminal cleavage/methylation domain-containing protein
MCRISSTRDVKMNAPCCARAGGFTLFEMIVVIVLTAVIFAVGGLLLGHSFQSFVTARDDENVGAQGRVALERMEREIRAVRTQDANGMTTLQANNFQFIDTDGNTVGFYYNSGAGQVMRSDGTNTYPLADNVTAMNYEYTDSGGNVLTIPPTATSVYGITVSLAVAKGGLTQNYRVTLVPRRFQ